MWYYRGLADAFAGRIKDGLDSSIITEFGAEVSRLFDDPFAIEEKKV